jgi:hypothetical protein
MKSFLTTTVLMTSISMFSGTVEAGHPKSRVKQSRIHAAHAERSIEELVHTLRNQAAQACWEIRRNYWETPQSQYLYKDVYEVYSQSNHIYKILHRGETVKHILRDLEELDDSLHHAEELANKMNKHESQHARSSRFYYDSHGGLSIRLGHSRSRGYSSHSVRHLRELGDTLDEMQDSLHDLQEKISPKKHQIAPPVPPAPHGAAVFPIRAGRYSFSFSIR